MKEVIEEKIRGIETAEEKYNILREFLQAMILKSVEENGYIKNMAFVGGTALRLLYDLNRFSEDMDFSLVTGEKFNAGDFFNALSKTFNGWNLKVEYAPKTSRNVVSSFLKFPNILYDNNISHRKEQKLFIKLEIDTKPPAGFITDISFNNKYMPVNVFHYDISSLFAGKLHAILHRQYTKGRDLYDLLWFLGRKAKPNIVQLENAIYQTTKKKIVLDLNILATMVKKKLSEMNFEKVHQELGVFLLDKSELKYVTKDSIEQLLDRSFLASIVV